MIEREVQLVIDEISNEAKAFAYCEKVTKTECKGPADNEIEKIALMILKLAKERIHEHLSQ